MAGDDAAGSVYRVVEEAPGRVERAWRMVVALVVGVFTMGAGPTNRGGQRLQVVDARTGEIRRTWTEQFSDDSRTLAAQMHRDLEQMTADEFAGRWILPDPTPGAST